MSVSLIIVLVVVVIFCVIVFQKTVAGDAENDFKIRDVLSRPDILEEDKPSVEQEYSYQEKVEDSFYATSNNHIVEPEENTSLDYEEFKTNSHEDDLKENKSEEIFRKEIEESIKEEPKKSVYVQKDSSKYIEKEKIVDKKSKNFFEYVKMFWRGVTFTVGMLICLASVFGIFVHTQTSNDALIYSIWALIGVILIK